MQYLTMFSGMQGDSNVRQPPAKHTFAEGKCIHPSLRWSPRNKMCVKNGYYSIDFIHLIHNTCQILSTFTSQCHSLHLPWSCLHSLLTSHPPHCHLTTYHHHVSFTALDVQQALLKTLHSPVWWDALTKWYIYVCWFINLLEPLKIHNFLHRCWWC